MLLLLLVGCTIKERDLTGPQIHINMDQGFISVSDEFGSMPEFRLDTDPSYSIDITLSASAGEEDNGTTLAYSPVKSFTATYTIPSITVPAVDYTEQADGDDRVWMSSGPLVIPGGAKGQTMHVHVDAVDGNGLASNLIDLDVAMN
ncbi:MAG: hypothetical protein ABI678_19090 [Kofleriaceae bacterium]